MIAILNLVSNFRPSCRCDKQGILKFWISTPDNILHSRKQGLPYFLKKSKTGYCNKHLTHRVRFSVESLGGTLVPSVPKHWSRITHPLQIKKNQLGHCKHKTTHNNVSRCPRLCGSKSLFKLELSLIFRI